MRPEVKSKQFEISNRFEKSFHLHDNFTTAKLEILSPLKNCSFYMVFSQWQLSKP